MAKSMSQIANTIEERVYNFTTNKTKLTMNLKKILQVLSVIVIGITAFGIAMVSAMAFINPQSVMDLVGVQLPNTDAFSSIRGVYGGAGMTIFIALVYLAIKNQKLGLAFVSLLCGFYAFSRLITIAVEGNLGAFGQQWLVIESSMCLFALLLLFVRNKTETSLKTHSSFTSSSLVTKIS